MRQDLILSLRSSFDHEGVTKERSMEPDLSVYYEGLLSWNPVDKTETWDIFWLSDKAK